MFRAPAMLMPHESTVAHDRANFGSIQTFNLTPTGMTPEANPGPTLSQPLANPRPTPISTPLKPRLTKRADSQVPNLFANPPAVETQTHELDDDDNEEHSSSSN